MRTRVEVTIDRTAAKKFWERHHLGAFLKAMSLDPVEIIEVPDGEGPDFLLRWPCGEESGFEVRRVFADDIGRPSRMREDERYRTRWFQTIADRYYSRGGVPIRLSVQIWHRPTIDFGQRLADEVLAQANPLGIWGTTEQTIRDEAEARLAYLRFIRLPDSLVGYRRWTLYNDSIGWVHRLHPDRLEAVIKSKAIKLPQYRSRCSDVRLLLVADRSLNSGKIAYEGERVPNHGFTDVHLWHHPGGPARKVA